MFSASGRAGEITFSCWTKVFHYTIVVFSEGVPDLGGRIPLKPYTFQIGGQGERDDKNTMMRSLLFLPPFLSSLVLSLKNPSTAMDSPAALGFSTILWKEEDVGDKKCHFKQLSPGKCDKYCHPTTVGRGVTTRYGMEWRSACTSGMSRAMPISNRSLSPGGCLRRSASRRRSRRAWRR